MVSCNCTFDFLTSKLLSSRFAWKLSFLYKRQSYQTKLRTFPWFYRVPQSKLEANRLQGFRVRIGHKYTQTEITASYMCILAWEPSTDHVTQSFSRSLLPLKRFYRETLYRNVWTVKKNNWPQIKMKKISPINWNWNNCSIDNLI